MRVLSGAYDREKIHFEAPPADALEEEMRHFLSWWEESKGKVEGVIRAAVAHLWFVTIHPFEDGNGRIARAITDMALAQDDKQRARYYGLSAQIMSEREGYFNIPLLPSPGLCNFVSLAPAPPDPDVYSGKYRSRLPSFSLTHPTIKGYKR